MGGTSTNRPDKASRDWELRCLYADEGEAFRLPCEPKIGEAVMLRLRADKRLAVRSVVVLIGKSSRVPMRKERSDALFDWYEARIRAGFDPVPYRFLVDAERGAIVVERGGARWAEAAAPSGRAFRLVPGSTTPAWARGALQYQIFPDRFANGEPGNDVVPGEYAYDHAHVRTRGWGDLPEEDDFRCFYGGDLQGVMCKLDYLQSLGIEAIYLNPIFVSPSSHKYDAQDYLHVDPHLAVIRDDGGEALAAHDMFNGHASRYIERTTSAANLAQSDALFARLCAEIHRRGMKVILDGVFNHCGSFHRWMDREGVYRQAAVRSGASGRDDVAAGAYASPESPYRGFFRFDDTYESGYEAWWGFPTLPKLNYEKSAELCEQVFGVARHWAAPPYSIDGWRLDVAADLGHGEDFNHRFWKRFRREVKAVNPDLVIIAEHYGDPSAWLVGDQWDTVMNYDAFMEPLTYFLTGMEKHSDARDDALLNDGAAFCETMRAAMSRFGWNSLLCAMNELSNHDHSRFLTRTNRQVGRLSTAGPEAAAEGVDKRVLREAVVVQMTWPGAPTIYYGDEAGQVGWTDPDCRRTYPWDAEDEGLIELHRELARIRREHPALRDGSFAMLCGGEGWIAFGRFKGDDRLAVACNNADCEQVLDLPVRELGLEDGCAVDVRLATSGDRITRAVAGDPPTAVVRSGSLRVVLDARSAIVLAPR